jgi:hypothetical protein
MNLNPRAIALNGVGFAAAVLAVQGFMPLPAEAVTVQPVGGGGSMDWVAPEERLLAQAMEEDIVVMTLLQTMIEEL